VNEQQRASEPATSGGYEFDERLSVPLWWYLFAVGLGVLLGAEIHMGYPGVRSWIGYATLIPLFALALFWLGRTRVRVGGGQLSVGDRSVALRHVGRADVVRKADKQIALGPELDPQAYLMHRTWVPSVVRVEVLDPDDPAPYWVFSTREPEKLLEVLGRA
jgi:hypothetical protein